MGFFRENIYSILTYVNLHSFCLGTATSLKHFVVSFVCFATLHKKRNWEIGRAEAFCAFKRSKLPPCTRCFPRMREGLQICVLCYIFQKAILVAVDLQDMQRDEESSDVTSLYSERLVKVYWKH